MGMTTCWRARSHGLTDIGLVREVNEDSFWGDDARGIWAVADGMGGLARGDRAAMRLTQALAGLPVTTGLEDTIAGIENAVRNANREIRAEADSIGARMGTTAAILVLRGADAAVMWCGDSRVYRLRDNMLACLSRDHSHVQDLADRGLVSAAETATHPMRHMLTRAIGTDATVRLDARRDRVVPGDTYLLSTDGLHGVLDDAEIAAHLAAAPIAAAAAMVANCRARGAPDNVTLVIVRVPAGIEP